MIVWSKDMKIKKSHLRQIIQEEVSRTLSESADAKRSAATAAAIASIERQFGKGSVMSLNTGESLANTMRTQFGRADLEDLDSMVALHDELLEIGRNPSNAQANRRELSDSLIHRHPALNQSFIQFHLNRFLQIPESELSKVPSGAELKVEEIARREDLERHRREMPPEPFKIPKYGAWSRTVIDPETGEEKTIRGSGTHERWN